MASDIQPIAPTTGSTVAPVAPVPAIVPIKPTIRLGPVEVAIFSLNKFATHADCAQPALDYCHVVTGGFAGGMRLTGHHLAVSKLDKDVSPKQWNAATDRDPGGVGTADFAYLASHGRTDGSARKYDPKLQRTPWLYWFLTNTDSADGCWISTIELHVRSHTWVPPDLAHPKPMLGLGDGRLRWVVLDACRSQQLRDVNETDLTTRATLAEAIPGDTWYRCYDGVHMLFGFTGLSSDAWWTMERGLAFGKRAGRGETLAESWIDEAYSWIIKGVDAPVVTAFGQSPAEVTERLTSESLKKPGRDVTRPIRTVYWASCWRA